MFVFLFYELRMTTDKNYTYIGNIIGFLIFGNKVHTDVYVPCIIHTYDIFIFRNYFVDRYRHNFCTGKGTEIKKEGRKQKNLR